MKRSKFKINVGFKKVLASFLTITMLGFQANIMELMEIMVCIILTRQV